MTYAQMVVKLMQITGDLYEMQLELDNVPRPLREESLSDDERCRLSCAEDLGDALKEIGRVKQRLERGL